MKCYILWHLTRFCDGCIRKRKGHFVMTLDDSHSQVDLSPFGLHPSLDLWETRRERPKWATAPRPKKSKNIQPQKHTFSFGSLRKTECGHHCPSEFLKTQSLSGKSLLCPKAHGFVFQHLEPLRASAMSSGKFCSNPNNSEELLPRMAGSSERFAHPTQLLHWAPSQGWLLFLSCYQNVLCFW